jgi:rhamnogalacturonan endolyase
VWWDADPLRELHSRGVISKWNGATLGATQGSVQHVADITGDWREEIVTFMDGELRIYATPIPAVDRRVCLMQDPLYRNDVTHRSMGYPHVPMTSYYLGARRRSAASGASSNARGKTPADFSSFRVSGTKP